MYMPPVWHGGSGSIVEWQQNTTLDGGQMCPTGPHPTCWVTKTCAGSY